MAKDLEELRHVLLNGQRLSMQGSYARRAPAKTALPYLIEARTGLREYVQTNPAHEQAWRALSQAEECLLNYRAAISCLEQAMTLAGHRDRKDLKRMAMLKEVASEWAELKLSPEQLEELGNHLRTKLASRECDHTLSFTREWLETASHSPNKLITALRNRGGFCDCEVLNNVVSS